uniref:Uncharacterized protein n=1 Tax=Prorocentrum micans TaxID=2945 RepID=A0A7S2T9Z5_PROMC
MTHTKRPAPFCARTRTRLARCHPSSCPPSSCVWCLIPWTKTMWSCLRRVNAASHLAVLTSAGRPAREASLAACERGPKAAVFFGGEWLEPKWLRTPRYVTA